jgi:uncharacterized protein (TIGR01777 family)
MNEIKKQVILIAGGTGLVGRRLIEMLDKNKYEIIVLSRKPTPSNISGITFAKWDIDRQYIEKIPVPDHIVNLAGEGIADKRWTEDRKKKLVSSRVDSAKTIKKYLNDQHLKPLTYLSASAVGYYGDRNHTVLTEESDPGTGFLSECCQVWEESALETAELCHRHILLRIGIVLSMDGGALPKMTMTSGLRVYNYFGRGDQYYPWIHIDDLCLMMIYCIENNHIHGTYNACSPNSVTNKTIIGEVKKANNHFGVITPVPEFILRLSLGEMASVVLNSNNVSSIKIQSAGFRFKYPDIASAMQDLIGK